MSTIIARRPRRLWRAPLHVDFAEIFASLAKGGAAIYLGSPGSAAGSVIDALRKTKVKVKRDAGELAWMLTVTALVDAIRGAASSLDGRIDDADLAAFVDAVALFAGEHEWPLDSAFFMRPSRLPIVHDVAENFAMWLTKSGIDARTVSTARRDVIDGFAGAIDTAWRDGEPVWEPIRKTLGTPFVQAKRDSAAWRAYHDSLVQVPDAPLFDDTFSLRDIYIPLRGSLRRKGEQHPDLFDAADYLRYWLQTATPTDALRVVSGGPGSGKSSFVTMFTAETAERGSIDVLFIPLFQFELGEYLEEAIARFATSAGAPPDPFETGARRLLLVFDGVDELEMQGQHGYHVAADFMKRLTQMLQRRNAKGLRVFAIVTGREVLIQAIDAQVERSSLMPLQPFYVPPKLFQGEPKIVEADQRQEWWLRYAKLKGKSYDGLPKQLAREELNELTSQPLLNYLIALSFERGRVDFAAEPNLNVIYADLLDAVYERGWARERHPVTKRIGKDDFVTVLQEIAVTTAEGNGRTATVAEVARRCRQRGLERLLDRFAENAEAGLGRFLTVFYFRYRDERLQGDRTFEFTHKTFGEYLTAKWIVAEARTISPQDPDLLQWVTAFGRLHLDADLMRFFRSEVALLSPNERDRVTAVAQRVFAQATAYELPMDQLHPRPDFPTEVAMFEDAGTMALAFLSAIGRADGTPRAVITLDQPGDLRDWFNGFAHPAPPAYRPEVDSLSYLKFTAPDFSHTNLWRADFSHSELPEAKFDHAVLAHANFSGCNLREVRFHDAFMEQAIFTEKANLAKGNANSNLTGADLNGAILDQMHCAYTSFRNARVENASLRGTILVDCVLNGASFTDSDLTGVLIKGWVTGARFRGTTFVDANLSRATFAGCNFEGAVFGTTKVSKDTFKYCELTDEQRAGLVLVDPRDEEGC